jgi:cutinase
MFRVVLIAVVVALVAAACSADGGTVTDRGEWSETESCPDVFFLGARGSGQDPGIGPQLTDDYERFLGLLEPPRNIDVARYPLDYPASESNFGGASQYSDSVAAGVRELSMAVEMLGSRCGAARIVLGGYSQGAHVIAIADHAVLEASNVDAVILLANPVFAPDDPTEKTGTFRPDQGGIIRQVSINGALGERTIQLCLSGDPVCQFGSLAFWVHSGGYFGDVLDPTAEFAAGKVTANLPVSAAP